MPNRTPVDPAIISEMNVISLGEVLTEAMNNYPGGYDSAMQILCQAPNSVKMDKILGGDCQITVDTLSKIAFILGCELRVTIKGS